LTYELVKAGDGVSVDTLFRIDVGPTGTETKAFTDANGDNIWTQISETFVATQASSTPLA
jgi:hypothetical protein